MTDEFWKKFNSIWTLEKALKDRISLCGFTATLLFDRPPEISPKFQIILTCSEKIYPPINYLIKDDKKQRLKMLGPDIRLNKPDEIYPVPELAKIFLAIAIYENEILLGSVRFDASQNGLICIQTMVSKTKYINKDWHSLVTIDGKIVADKIAALASECYVNVSSINETDFWDSFIDEIEKPNNNHKIF